MDKWTRTDRSDWKDRPSGPHVVSAAVQWRTDDYPETSYLDQDEFEERKAEYERGEFHFEGCYAAAQVAYAIGGGSYRLEDFQSGGLWGIESDSGDDHRREVAAEELADLRGHLEKFGVDVSTCKELATP